MGFRMWRSIARKSWETDFVDGDWHVHIEILEFDPKIQPKIYLYFAANSFWREKGIFTSSVKARSNEENVVMFPSQRFILPYCKSHKLMLLSLCFKWYRDTVNKVSERLSV